MPLYFNLCTKCGNIIPANEEKPMICRRCQETSDLYVKTEARKREEEYKAERKLYLEQGFKM